jgi:CheY-like chemotaxis protein
MSRRPSIIWLDDNGDREKFTDTIKRETGLPCTFRNLHGVKAVERVDAILANGQPRLVILDHFLTNVQGRGAEKRGSNHAESIKEQWPSCPVIGVTAAANETKIDLRTRRAYDEVFSITDFDEVIPCLPHIIRGFEHVSKASPTSPSDVAQLLKPPAADATRLEAILPDELKRQEAISDRSFPSRLYTWTRQVLVSRPGFLIDRLWAATLVGVKENSFAKVEKFFRKAAYSGVFAFPSEPRWWASAVEAVVYRRVKPRDSTENSWVVGRKLPGVRREDYSKCHACNEDFPEIVAYIDETPTAKRYPMHIRCTVPHPRFKKELYFQEIRMMKGE